MTGLYQYLSLYSLPLSLTLMAAHGPLAAQAVIPLTAFSSNSPAYFPASLPVNIFAARSHNLHTVLQVPAILPGALLYTLRIFLQPLLPGSTPTIRPRLYGA